MGRQQRGPYNRFRNVVNPARGKFAPLSRLFCKRCVRLSHTLHQAFDAQG